MEDSENFFNVHETNGLPLWDAPQHECCVGDQDNVDSLRRRIKYYFMNPCEKYRARGRKPWKLMLQLVKIAIITVQVGSYPPPPSPAWGCGVALTPADTFLFPSTSQLVSFGLSNQMVVTFKEENLVTFKHLFLKNYADGDTDNYAIYRQADVYGYISHSIKQVAEHRLTRDAWCVCVGPDSSRFYLYTAGNHCCKFMTLLP